MYVIYSKVLVRSLMRWVDKYKNDGEIKRHNRKSIAYKIDKKWSKIYTGRKPEK